MRRLHRCLSRRVHSILLVTLLVYGCSGDSDSTLDRTVVPSGSSLSNEAWRIVKMATAHDVFTIEIEVDDLARARSVAEELLIPLKGNYSEILIYVYAEGEGEGGHIPAKRIQWTAADGLIETDY